MLHSLGSLIIFGIDQPTQQSEFDHVTDFGQPIWPVKNLNSEIAQQGVAWTERTLLDPSWLLRITVRLNTINHVKAPLIIVQCYEKVSKVQEKSKKL